MRSSNNLLDVVLDFFYENKLVARILSLICLVAALYLCWTVGINHEMVGSSMNAIPETMEQMQQYFPYLAVTMLDQETEPENAIEINLNGLSDTCEITKGGNYILTGKLDGNLLINAKEQNVHLFLNGVSISSGVGPAVYCQEADKLVITLMPGTENTIVDSGKFNPDEEVEACIYSECDMTLNGTGVLTVNGFYKDAIRSKDIVKILEGTYSIKCKRTAVHGNDGVVVLGGDFYISTEKYGFKTTKAGADGRGNLIIGGGKLSIIAGRYSFVTTKGNLFVYNCSVNQRSIVDTYDVGGSIRVQRGCVA